MTSWWPGDGNGNDLVGSNTLTTTGVTFSAGEVGQAFTFSGGSIVASVADPANGSLDEADTNHEISVDAWVKVDNTGGTASGTIVDKFDSSGVGVGYKLYISGNSVTAYVGITTGNAVVASHAYPQDNAWHHVAAVFSVGGGANPTEPTVWVDGNAVITNNLIGNNYLNSAPFKIGNGTTQGALTGQVDEVEVFSGKALTTAEVQAIFNAGPSGKCKPTSNFPTSCADFLAANPNANIINGTAGNDTLTGLPNVKNVIYGMGGNDMLTAGPLGDCLDGGDGNDHLIGGNGDDLLVGGIGADWLEGRGGNDILRGGADTDRLDGGIGSDTCFDTVPGTQLISCELLNPP